MTKLRVDFTSWDDEDDDAGIEHVVPLVLGERPGTRDYWRVNYWRVKPPFRCELLESEPSV